MCSSYNERSPEKKQNTKNTKTHFLDLVSAEATSTFHTSPRRESLQPITWYSTNINSQASLEMMCCIN